MPGSRWISGNGSGASLGFAGVAGAGVSSYNGAARGESEPKVHDSSKTAQHHKLSMKGKTGKNSRGVQPILEKEKMSSQPFAHCCCTAKIQS